jgi:hypothetical protein
MENAWTVIKQPQKGAANKWRCEKRMGYEILYIRRETLLIIMSF